MAGKFHEMLKRHEIAPSTVHEFDAASKGLKLPAHMAAGGEVTSCPACGYAFGGEVEGDADDAVPGNLDETVNDPDEERRRYASVLQRGGY